MTAKPVGAIYNNMLLCVKEIFPYIVAFRYPDLGFQPVGFAPKTGRWPMVLQPRPSRSGITDETIPICMYVVSIVA